MWLAATIISLKAAVQAEEGPLRQEAHKSKKFLKTQAATDASISDNAGLCKVMTNWKREIPHQKTKIRLLKCVRNHYS